MITPMDIHNKEFEKGFRGYDTEAVDAFMTELVHDYEVLYRENREMTDKIEQLEKRLAQYEQMEATMNNTLALAQETGENVKKSARKEADLILQEAEQERQNILRDAQRSLREAHDKYAVIRNEIAVFRAKMESILNSQLQLLDGCVLGESKIAVDTATMDTDVEIAEEEALATDATTSEEPVVDVDDTVAEESQKTQNI